MSQNPELSSSKSFKFSQSDLKTINQNQLNTSTSKMQYSIPKAKRFAIPHDSSADKFYDIPDTKTARSTSMGYGKKMDISQQYFMKPSVGKYELHREFQDKDGKKGITMSAGREVIKTNSVFEVKKNIPGPGAYNPKDPMKGEDNQQRGYMISAKSEDITNKWKNQIPGPGNYSTSDLLDQNLKSKNSKYQSVRSSKFSKKQRRSEFDERIKQKVPGPGEYGTIAYDFYAGRFSHHSGNKFQNSPRKGIVEKSSLLGPGPGEQQFFGYFSNYFSEFLK